MSTNLLPKMESEVGDSKAPEWRNVHSSLGKSIAYIFENGLYSDMVFKVGPTNQQTQIKAHKTVVISRSEVFATKLQKYLSPIAQYESLVINIPDVNPESFQVFLKFLYTDEFSHEPTVTVALDVLQLARVYQVPALISTCAKLIKERIAVNTCVEIYQRTVFYNDMTLSRDSHEFLTGNIAKVALDDQFLHLNVKSMKELLEKDNLDILEIELFRALIRWGKETGQVPDVEGRPIARQTVLPSLARLIRYPLMGAKAFAKEVVPTKVLNEQDVIEMFLYFNGEGPAPKGIPCIPRKPQFYTVSRCGVEKPISIESLPSGQWNPVLKFMVDQPVVIQGLRFVGKDIVDSFEDFCLTYKISLKSGVTGAKFQKGCEDTQSSIPIPVKESLQRCMPTTNPAIREDQFDVLLGSPEQVSPGHWCQVDLCLKRLSADVLTFDRKDVKLYDSTGIQGIAAQNHSESGVRFEFEPMLCESNVEMAGMLSSILFTQA